MPDFIISLTFMSALSFIMDRSVPQTAVLYGSRLLSIAETEKVKVFYAHYGWVRFPRTVFVVLAIFLESASNLWPSQLNIFLSMSLASIGLWMGNACFDVFKASRAANRAFP